MYEVVYAVGTSKHDERNYVGKVSADGLAARITRYQAEGKRVVSVREVAA